MKQTMTWTGIAAETWDATGGDDPSWDHDFFHNILEEHPGLALDVGCGAGRLLIRFLEYGLDIEGLELSADMLEICRRKAEAKGFNPILYRQDMRTMNLPQKYRTIIIPCGSFMLILDYEEAKQTMRRFYEHLEPGGILAFTLFDMFGFNPENKTGEWRTPWHFSLADDSEMDVSFYIDSLDQVEQLFQGRRHYQIKVDGKLTREQYLDDTFRWYSPNEIRLLLELSGFELLSACGNNLHEAVNETHWGMAVVARKV